MSRTTLSLFLGLLLTLYFSIATVDYGTWGVMGPHQTDVFSTEDRQDFGWPLAYIIESRLTYSIGDNRTLTIDIQSWRPLGLFFDWLFFSGLLRLGAYCIDHRPRTKQGKLRILSRYILTVSLVALCWAFISLKLLWFIFGVFLIGFAMMMECDANQLAAEDRRKKKEALQS